MKATFNNQTTRNFSFSHYIKVKYLGLFPENFPTWKEIKLLSSDAAQMRRGPEQTAKIKDKQQKMRKYEALMTYWRKLQ